MKIEIKFVRDTEATDIQEFMNDLTKFIEQWEWVLNEVRIVREPKQ